MTSDRPVPGALPPAIDVQYEDGIYRGRLAGVRVVTFTDRRHGHGDYGTAVGRLLDEIKQWVTDHPDAAILRVEFDAWDDGDVIVRQGQTAAERLLLQLDLHPKQLSGEIPKVCWTAQVVLYYDLGIPRSELVDWEVEGWA